MGFYCEKSPPEKKRSATVVVPGNGFQVCYYSSTTTVAEFSKIFFVFYKWPDLSDVQGIEDFFLNPAVDLFPLLLFASTPGCSQNRIAVSDTLNIHLLSDF